MSKLQNVKAISDLLQGQHKSQTKKTFGWSDAAVTGEKNKKREVGEVWEETNPVTGVTYRWEQRDGYRVKTSSNFGEFAKEIRDFLHSFPNCPKETCTCSNPTRLDEKFKKKMGMCEDCVISMETNLKIKGSFDHYAKEKMRQNAESFFKQYDVEVENIKKELTKPITFVENADGGVEKWESSNPRALTEQIDAQYNEYKTKIMEKLND